MHTHFDRLGLPRRFALDAAELERQYLARSRAVHPDFHATGSASELAASLELSAAINEAYNTLRDDFTRADYLLTLAGGPTATESKQVPPAFLAEMLDLREEVESARGDPAATRRLNDDFAARLAALLADAGARFDALPADGPERVAALAAIRGLLNAAKYVRGLLRDLHAD